MPDNEESPVTSVDRALRILTEIGEAPRGLSLDDLWGRLRIPKSSLHRILAALKYALIHPLLARLTSELNETTHMAVLDGAEVVYQDKLEATHSIKLSSVIGGRNPANATGVGKALLAWTYPTDEALHAWARLHGPLPTPTQRTVGSVSKLAEQLAEVRHRGYALDVEENETGVRCAAVPIFLGRPSPAAAVSITVLGARAEPPRLTELGEYLSRTAAEWSLAPGG